MKKFRNKILSLILSVCMVLGLVVVPTKVSDHSHAHAADTATEHDCGFNNSSELTQQMMDAFVAAGRIDCGSYDFASYGPLFIYAASDINWSGDVVLPDGAFIAICTAGYDYSMGNLVKEGDGGVYILDCSVDVTAHTDCQAFTDADIINVSQAFVDLQVGWFECYGAEGASIFGGDAHIALTEDVTIDSELVCPPEGVTLNICKNGYTLTVAEGLELEKNGGTVNILDCQNMPQLIHSCNVAGGQTIPLTRDNIEGYLAQLSTAQGVVYMHLAEDISFEGTISAPDGAFIALCRNGFTLTGNIDNGGNTAGGFYLYECQSHTCTIAGQSMDARITLTQDIVDFLEALYAYSGETFEDGHFALAEDVTLSSDIWVSDSNDSFSFCKNGYSITDNAGINLGYGHVNYIDCNTYAYGDIMHESQLFGESYPMAQETLNNLSEALAPFLVTGSVSANYWNYWSVVGSDGQIYYFPYAPVISEDGVIVGTTSIGGDQRSSFALIPVYDNTGVANGYAYQVYVVDSTQASARYTTYLDVVPVLDADGVSTGEVTLAFSDTTPTAVFNYNSTYATYTTTVDGVEYYLGSPDGSGVFAPAPVSSLATGGAAIGDNSLEYRYDGEDGLFIFHLSEDVSWEGTLSVPDGNAVVIITNGHTATGEYTHGDKGGVYIMDDSIHVCAATGEAYTSISDDLIDIMLAMNGGIIEMPAEYYVALGENIDRVDPRFTIPSGTDLYICKNGYTLSDAAYETLVAGGGRIIYLDCSSISHDCEKLGGSFAEMANSYLFANYYQDKNGTFALAAGEYYLYLTSNTKLEKTLVVPSGVTLHICLNGFTLTSPIIMTKGNSNYDPAKECYGAIEVQYGATLKVYDCSEGQTGLITINTEDGMNGWGALAAYAVSNSGTFTLDSGSLFGMITVINSGDVVVDGGDVLGVLASVMQGSELTDQVGAPSADTTPSITINDGSVNAIGLGVVGAEGEVKMNGGTITSGLVGVAGTSDLESFTDGGADLTLNGGTINVGAIDLDAFESVGFEFTSENSPEIVDADMIIGVVASSDVVISADVVINIDEQASELADTTVDIMLAEGATMTVTPSTKGQSNSFDVIGTEGESTPAINAPEGAIEAGDGYVTETNANGETIVVPIESTAKVYSSTVSMQGLIKLNLYMVFTESFLNNESARILINYKGVDTEYTVSDTKKSGNYYVLTLGISAKDYLETVTVSFTDGEIVWAAGNTTVDWYFNYLLNDTTGTYDDVTKEAVRYMQNYCMAAAAHFASDTYTYAPTTEIQEWMDAFDTAVFDNYKNYTTGSSENVKIVSASLLLESGTTARIYFQVNEGVDVNNLEILVNGEAATATLYSATNRYYYVDVENISAKNLADVQEISIDGLVAHYAGLTYCYMILQTADSQPQELINVCKALYGYYEAAQAYANK